jgi:hypothetical protein
MTVPRRGRKGAETYRHRLFLVGTAILNPEFRPPFRHTKVEVTEARSEKRKACVGVADRSSLQTTRRVGHRAVNGGAHVVVEQKTGPVR